MEPRPRQFGERNIAGNRQRLGLGRLALARALGRLERLPLVWKDIRTYGLNQKNEQMFVRISSNARIEDLFADPANGGLFEALTRLGIFKDSPWK